MPLSSNALTTLEAAKSYLDLTTTDKDELITELINATSSAITQYCRRNFVEQTYTDEEYDGNGTSYLYLSEYPVKDVVSVKIDEAEIPATDYKCKKSTGKLIRKNGVWTCGDINIQVTYTAGLSEVPPDVELACKHLVMFYFKTDISDFSTTFGEGVVIRPEALPGQVKALLNPYKKVLV